jgi:hypothetical protein
MNLRLTNGDEKPCGFGWGGSLDPRAIPWSRLLNSVFQQSGNGTLL